MFLSTSKQFTHPQTPSIKRSLAGDSWIKVSMSFIKQLVVTVLAVRLTEYLGREQNFHIIQVGRENHQN